MDYLTYKKSLRKIVKYSRFRGVRLHWLPDLSSKGCFIPSAKRNDIYVDNLLAPKERIAVLLHEIGHHLDYCADHMSFYSREIIEARARMTLEIPLTREQKDSLLKCERRAWKKAKGIAIRLQIPLGLWFYKEQKSNLASYIRIPVMVEPKWN